MTTSAKLSGSCQKSRWPRSGKTTSWAPGMRSASSLPLRGSTTVSAAPCSTSVRARMRVCRSRPTYRAPAAAWARHAPGAAGRERWSSTRRSASPGWRLAAAHRQGILHVAAQRNLARHAAGRGDQPQRGGWHGVGEGPAGRRGHENQGVNPLAVVNRQLLSHHAAQARAHHVGPADPRLIKHGDDVSSHVGDIKRSSWQAAAPAPPVVHQHEPEVPPQFPQHRPPPGAVQSPSPGSGPARAAATAASLAARRRSAAHHRGHTVSGSRRCRPEHTGHCLQIISSARIPAVSKTAGGGLPPGQRHGRPPRPGRTAGSVSTLTPSRPKTQICVPTAATSPGLLKW